MREAVPSKPPTIRGGRAPGTTAMIRGIRALFSAGTAAMANVVRSGRWRRPHHHS
jgi:hypothetical protein